MSFTKATLETAMNKLAQAGKIFSNESQFQFDLAWELRKMGFDVELEVLSADCTPSQFAALPKEDKKRYYPDTVIKDDNEFIQRYTELTNAIKNIKYVSGYCYTQ